MGRVGQQALERAFEQIEESILPSISLLLDSLLEAAAAARPGVDARVHAAELQTIALHLEDLTRQVESISPARYAPAGEPIRISA